MGETGKHWKQLEKYAYTYHSLFCFQTFKYVEEHTHCVSSSDFAQMPMWLSQVSFPPWVFELSSPKSNKRVKKKPALVTPESPPKQQRMSHPALTFYDYYCQKIHWLCYFVQINYIRCCFFSLFHFCLFVKRMLVGSFAKWCFICLKFLVWSDWHF